MYLDSYRCNDQWSTDSTSSTNSTTADPTTCANRVTGTITVTAPLGAGLSYSSMELIIQTQQEYLMVLAPGTYNVTVQNAAGCISSATTATINGAPAGPAAPTVTTADPTTCATRQERSQ
jgi:hypothetical protein